MTGLEPMYRNMVIHQGAHGVIVSMETSGSAEAWPKIFNEIAQHFCDCLRRLRSSGGDRATSFSSAR